MATAVKKLQNGADALAEGLQNLSNMLKNGMDSAREFFQTRIVPGVKNFARDAADLAGTVKDGLVSGLQSAGSFISDKSKIVGNYLKDKAGDAKEFIQDNAQKLGAYIKEKAGDAREFIRDKAQDAREYLKEKAGDAKEFIRDKAHDAREYLKEKAGDAKEFIREKAGDAKEFIQEKTQEFGNFVKDKAQELKSNIAAGAHDLGDKIKLKISTTWENVKQQAPVLINNAREKVQQWIQSTPEKLEQLKESLGKKKEAFMQKLKENKEKISEWYNKAKENFPRINFKRGEENSPEGNALETSTDNATSIDNSLNNDRKPLLPIVREKIQAIKATLLAAADTLKTNINQIKEDFLNKHPNIQADLSAAAASLSGIAGRIGTSASNAAKRAKKFLEDTSIKIQNTANQIKDNVMQKIDQITNGLKQIPGELTALAGQFKDFVKETIANIRAQMAERLDSIEMEDQVIPEQDEPEIEDLEQDEPEQDELDEEGVDAPPRKPTLGEILGFNRKRPNFGKLSFNKFMKMEWVPIINNNGKVFGAHLKDPAMRAVYVEFEKTCQTLRTPRMQKFMEFKQKEIDMKHNPPEGAINLDKDQFEMEAIPVTPEQAAQGLRISGVQVKDPIIREALVKQAELEAQIEKTGLDHLRIPGAKSMPSPQQGNLDGKDMFIPHQDTWGDRNKTMPHQLNDDNKPVFIDDGPVRVDAPIKTGIDDIQPSGPNAKTDVEFINTIQGENQQALPQILIDEVAADPITMRELITAIRKITVSATTTTKQVALEVIQKIQIKIEKNKMQNLPAHGQQKPTISNYAAREIDNPSLGG